MHYQLSSISGKLLFVSVTVIIKCAYQNPENIHKHKHINLSEISAVVCGVFSWFMNALCNNGWDPLNTINGLWQRPQPCLLTSKVLYVLIHTLSDRLCRVPIYLKTKGHSFSVIPLRCSLQQKTCWSKQNCADISLLSLTCYHRSLHKVLFRNV